MRRLWFLVGCLALAACTANVTPPDVAATGPRCLAPSAASPSPAPAPSGSPLPAMALPCFEGGRYTDVALLGSEPTLVNVWGSWCPPCREELPALQQIAAAGHVRVVGIVTKDRHDMAQSVIEDLHLTFPMLEDPGQQFVTAASPLVGRALFTLPVTLFVAPGGRVAYVYQGPALTLDKARELTGQYLGVTA